MTAVLLLLAALGAAPAAAQSGATRGNSPAQSAPVPCGPACRWTSEAAERTRAAWPEVRAAATLEGVSPVLLASVCAWESGMRPVRGGLGGRMLGPCQVDPTFWLTPMRARHGAGLVADDLAGMAWGLAAGALALRHALDAAGGREGSALCAYAHGPKALAWQECPYSRAVVATGGLVRRDLGDLVEDRT